MKSLLIAIALTVASAPVAVAESATKDVYVGSANQGKVKSATCSACHGSDGNSASADYPKLAGQHASYLASTLRAYRDGSRENAIMAGLAAVLSEEDIADLSAYYATQAVSSGAVQAELLERGEQLYRFGDTEKGISACAACHGQKGEGNLAMNAPAIAGQEDWYLLRQLKAFKSGIRGTHPKDVYGTQMRPMAMMLADEQAMKDVIAHVKTFPKAAKEDMSKWGGNASKGASAYATCAACHGPKAKGQKALNAPALTQLPSWYL